MSFSRTNDQQPRRQPSALERDALYWLALLDRGMTREQEAEFERWLAADPRHAQMFGEFDGTWTLLDRVRERPEAVKATLTGEVDPDALAPTREHAAARRASAPARRPGMARARRGREVSLALLSAAAIAMSVYVVWWRPHQTVRQGAYQGSVATELGGLQTLNLPDGSIVQLNTDSAVEVHYTADQRQIQMARGEAHFTVAKNPRRPFIVSANGVEVQAVGTAFNVRMRPESVEVLVTEGRVRLNEGAKEAPQVESAGSDAGSSASADAAVREAPLRRAPLAEMRPLSAGEKITISLAAPALEVAAPALPVAVPAVEIERVLAWQERRLEFVAVPLAEMVEEFNRYHRRKLVIADEALAAQRFGGTFRPDDAEGFVKVLESSFGVNAEYRDEAITLRLAR